MKRRQAIRRIGMGLGSGFLLPSLLDSCGTKEPAPEINFDGTIAVIGAGAAGLYVADILHTKGIKVSLFEAREQIGGRVRSVRNQGTDTYPIIPKLSSDFPLELGAQTIHGSDSIFGKIFTDYQLPTIEFPSSSFAYVMDNTAKLGTDWGSDPDYVAASNFRANLKSYAGSAQSVLQASQSAGVSTRAANIVNATTANPYGSNSERMGIGALGENEALKTHDGKFLSLKSNPMQDALISRFSNIQQFVQLKTPITSINYGAKPISLTAKDGTTYTADKVIVTVPLSVLKNNLITFTPSLPAVNTGAMGKFGFDACIRVILEFKKNFWGDTTGLIFGSTGVPEYFSYGMGRSQFNATLTVTVCGPRAAQLSALGDGAIDAILSDLDGLYKDANKQGLATQFIRQDITTLERIYLIQDWTKMDYILGGYSYPMPGTKNSDRKSLSTPVNNVLFFAGEATDVSGEGGSVNGALASAERCAQEVIDAIQKGL